jgi:hypothetical protein
MITNNMIILSNYINLVGIGSFLLRFGGFDDSSFPLKHVRLPTLPILITYHTNQHHVNSFQTKVTQGHFGKVKVF